MEEVFLDQGPQGQGKKFLRRYNLMNNHKGWNPLATIPMRRQLIQGGVGPLGAPVAVLSPGRGSLAGSRFVPKIVVRPPAEPAEPAASGIKRVESSSPKREERSEKSLAD